MRVDRWKMPAVLAALLVVTGCGGAGPSTAPGPGGATGGAGVIAPVAVEREQPGAGTAAGALATLPVKGRAPKTGYEREQFGQRWADIDRDGCDQRNQVLARDMEREAFKPGTRDCVVLTGSLQDAYTGRTIAFSRGTRTSSAVQIDHVVALSDAWQKGAQQLDEDTRERIGNDPLNLIAVDGPTNARKGDGDAATWLPPESGYRCAYVSRQVAVKTKYELWVTAAERDAINRVLGGCPGRTASTDADAGRPAIALR